MATQPDDPNADDQTLELTEEQEVQEPDEGGEDEDRGGDEEETTEVNGEGDEETVISWGDDTEPQEDDNSTIRHLRERLKESEREKAELRKAIPQKQRIEIGEKPTHAGCGYDDDVYEAELLAWKERKDAAAEEDARAQETEREVQESWQRDFQSFEQKKQKLATSIPDIDDAQQAVVTSLDMMQQAVLVKAADDPALMMVALARSPAKLAELSKIKDPIKLAAAMARMEGGIKMVTRRKAPAPDRAQKGSAVIEASDKKLERLEKEAEASGDRSKVIAYKRSLKEKAK